MSNLPLQCNFPLAANLLQYSTSVCLRRADGIENKGKLKTRGITLPDSWHFTLLADFLWVHDKDQGGCELVQETTNAQSNVRLRGQALKRFN